jgi:AhpD family alkylhydroperoxidase
MVEAGSRSYPSAFFILRTKGTVVVERSSYNRKFTLRDLYVALVHGFQAFPRMIANRVSRRVDAGFIERIMLATTEVNGCELCSYAHARLALAQGIPKEEIEALLAGDPLFIREEEAKGLLFAQHYADTRSRPDRAAYQALVSTYGTKEAKTIVAAVQAMTFGNLVGIPWSALIARFRGRAYENSSPVYELTMILASVLFLPIAFVHALLRGLFFRGPIRFARPHLL